MQHLVAIARIVESSPALQTDLIESLLRSYLEEAKCLEASLAQLIADPDPEKIVRYWKAIGGVTKEKRISAICERLEKEKSAITLCIVSIDSLVYMSASLIPYSTLIIIRRQKSATAFTKSSSKFLQFKI